MRKGEYLGESDQTGRKRRRRRKRRGKRRWGRGGGRGGGKERRKEGDKQRRRWLRKEGGGKLNRYYNVKFDTI